MGLGLVLKSGRLFRRRRPSFVLPTRQNDLLRLDHQHSSETGFRKSTPLRLLTDALQADAKDQGSTLSPRHPRPVNKAHLLHSLLGGQFRCFIRCKKAPARSQRLPDRRFLKRYALNFDTFILHRVPLTQSRTCSYGKPTRLRSTHERLLVMATSISMKFAVVLEHAESFIDASCTLPCGRRQKHSRQFRSRCRKQSQRRQYLKSFITRINHAGSEAESNLNNHEHGDSKSSGSFGSAPAVLFSLPVSRRFAVCVLGIQLFEAFAFSGGITM